MAQKRRPAAKPVAKVVELDSARKAQDMEDIPDDAWWVFVLPSQEAAPVAIPTGRYGYWKERPIVEEMESGYSIFPKGSESGGEPIMKIPYQNATTVWVAQMKHARNPTVEAVS